MMFLNWHVSRMFMLNILEKLLSTQDHILLIFIIEK